MRHLQAILFDLDGTLVGTHPQYRYQMVGDTLKELGCCAEQCDMDKFWFGANRDAIIGDLFALDPTVFWKAFARYDTAESVETGKSTLR